MNSLFLFTPFFLVWMNKKQRWHRVSMVWGVLNVVSPLLLMGMGIVSIVDDDAFLVIASLVIGAVVFWSGYSGYKKKRQGR